VSFLDYAPVSAMSKGVTLEFYFYLRDFVIDPPNRIFENPKRSRNASMVYWMRSATLLKST
jgi:hypothetical protein